MSFCNFGLFSYYGEALGEYMLTRLHMLLLLVNQQQKKENILEKNSQNGDGVGDGDYEHVCVLPTAVLLIHPTLPLLLS